MSSRQLFPSQRRPLGLPRLFTAGGLGLLAVMCLGSGCLDTSSTIADIINELASCTVLERVSVSSAGAEANAASLVSGINADGQFVVFESDASNLVPGDTNGATDIFVRDRTTGTTARVSVDSTGIEANADSFGPVISADGRIVAFWSAATNLVAGDTNGVADIFVHDRTTGATVRISVDGGGVQADGGSLLPRISADGRFVTFESSATNLVVGDANGVSDIFVHDQATGTTIRVSVDSAGVEQALASFAPEISPDGLFVAFTSAATALVAGDTNGVADVFVHDLTTGVTIRASVDSAGLEANGPSGAAAFSLDGGLLLFESLATNLVAGDTNAVQDVFLRDLTSGLTERISVSSGGAEANAPSTITASALSADGRFAVFQSLASNLVSGDGNGVADVFLRDRNTGTTVRISLDVLGIEVDAASLLPLLSGDGLLIAFASDAANLIGGDTNGVRDVFVAGDCLAP